MDSSPDSIGIDVPESVLVKGKEEPIHGEQYSRRRGHRKGDLRGRVSDRPGRVVLRKRLPRATFLEFFAQLPRATVVMEACGSAHHWARRIEELGHVVVLLPPSTSDPT